MKQILISLLAVTVFGYTHAFAQKIKIAGDDTGWHVLSDSLQKGSWYEITLTSTVKYSQSEEHKQLHIELSGAAAGTHDFAAKSGVTVLKEKIKVDAKSDTLKIRIKDDYTGDNSGTLEVSIRQFKSE